MFKTKQNYLKPKEFYDIIQRYDTGDKQNGNTNIRTQ
jgi:hypothetical protein